MPKESRLQPVWLLMVTAMIAVTTFGPTGLIAQEDPEKRGLTEESQTSEKGAQSRAKLGHTLPDPPFLLPSAALRCSIEAVHFTH